MKSKNNLIYNNCIHCGVEKNKSYTKKSKSCRSCSKLEAMKERYKNQDVIFVNHSAGKKGNQKVVKFKSNCSNCKKDRGYVFKADLKKFCSSCVAKNQYIDGRDINHNFYAIRDYVNTPSQGNVLTRSSYETFYLKHLNSKNINYFYEPKRFKLSDGSSYLPDVYLVEEDKFIELKGLDRKEDKAKFEKFKQEYAKINIEKLTKKDLMSLGYSPKLYQNYRYITINSDRWKIIVLDSKEFDKVVGADCDAITNLNDKELIFNINNIDSKTITHEIAHVYYSYTNTERAGLDETQREEVLCEFISYNMARILYHVLHTQELIEDICNIKYSLSIKINYFDLDMTNDQFLKLKKGLLISGFRYDSVTDYMEKTKGKTK